MQFYRIEMDEGVGDGLGLLVGCRRFQCRSSASVLHLGSTPCSLQGIEAACGCRLARKRALIGPHLFAATTDVEVVVLRLNQCIVSAVLV